MRIAFASLLVCGKPAIAQDSSLNSPEPLKPWLTWVQDRQPELRCAVVGETRLCRWPGQLSLVVAETGASFLLRAALDSRGSIALPGNSEVWPRDVEIKNSVTNEQIKASVILSDDRPSVELPAGSYEFRGSFAWTTQPETFEVPENIGPIELTVNGARIDRPEIDDQNNLWLGSKDEKTETSEATLQPDSFSVKTSRLLADGIPFSVTTRLDLEVTGKSRKLVLSSFALQSAQPVSVTTDLQYVLKPDGTLELSAKPGEHAITITSLFSVPPQTIAAPKPSGPEWAPQEYWAWSANPEIRSARLSGIPAVDATRTWLPSEWQSFPSYLVKAGSESSLETLRQGETDVPPNQLSLGRSLWLDVASGSSLTSSDTFSGMLHNGWRLDTLPGNELTRASIGVTPLLITQNPQNPSERGAEIRSSQLQAPTIFSGLSRTAIADRSIDAVGWDVAAQQLTFELNVPPNKMLVHVSGADEAYGTWTDSWTILEFCFGIVLVLGFFKLHGFRGATVAFGCFVCAHKTALPNDIWWPHGVWIALFAALALKRLATQPVPRALATAVWFPVGVFATAIVAAFSFRQIRLAILPFSDTQFPQTLPYWQASYSPFEPGDVTEFFSAILFDGPLGLAVLLFAICAIAIAFLHRRFKLALGLIAFEALAFFLLVAGSTTGSAGYRADYATSAGGPAQQAFAPQAARSVTAMRQKSLAAPAPAPKSPSAPMEMLEDGAVASGDLGIAGSADTAAFKEESIQAGAGGNAEAESFSGDSQQLEEEIDPQAVTQTGVAVPMWRHDTFNLQFRGTVKKDQKLKLCILGGVGQSLLRLASAIFALLLLGIVFGHFRLHKVIAPALLLVLTIGWGTPNDARAQNFPGTELLNELQKKYAETVCKTDCTFASTVRIEVVGSRATITAEVASRGTGAWPVPGPLSEFYPESITVDSVSSAGSFRNENGYLLARIPDGKHRVVITGRLADKASVGLTFEQRPGNASATARGWEIDGISDTGYVDSAIGLSRSDGTPGENSASDDAVESAMEEVGVAALPQWFRVQRTLEFGVQWRVRTVVSRLGDAERAESAKFPLLPGEKLVSSDVKADGGLVTLNFQRGETTASWIGTLESAPTLTLRSGTVERQSESWSLRCSALWRCSAAGLTPVSSFDNDGPVLTWLPIGQDSVTITAVKPAGTTGSTKTIDRIEYIYSVSPRTVEVQTHFWIRTSSGSQEEIALPADALLKSASIDGSLLRQPLHGSKLTLDFIPGNHQVTLSWELPQLASVRQVLPVLEFQTPPFNFFQTLSVQQEWIIVGLTGTPWKTSLVYWFKLAALLILAIVARRTFSAPLALPGCIAAAFLLSFCSWGAAFCFALWIAVFEYRRTLQLSNELAFNLWQLALVLLTGATAIVLMQALQVAFGDFVNVNTNATLDGYRTLVWYAESTVNLPPSTFYSIPRGLLRAIILATAIGFGFSIYRMWPYLRDVLLSEGIWRWPRRGIRVPKEDSAKESA